MRPSTSPAESFYSHGLHGIELSHVAERRALAVIQHRDASARLPQPTGPLRRHVGQLLIGLGQVIAGCRAARPHTARFV